jgi:EmrB/QacA subfamily drug resistance transporter
MPFSTVLPADAGVGHAKPQPPSYRLVALIVSSSLLMQQLDATVLATSLPRMAETFGTSPVRMSIALTSYLLSLAVFIPASGNVADRFGARRIFCAAIGIFTIGSMLCGQADSLPFLVASRLLQGLGGAMMVPVGRLVLLRSVKKEELVDAMAWFLVPALIGPIIGPPLGGFITTYLSWRWIFYINLPFGVVGMVLVLRYIGDLAEPVPAPFDWPGLAYSGTSLGCLLFGLELISRGQSLPLDGLLLGIGAVFGGLYWLHARRHPQPILDLKLLSIPTFGLSVLAGSLTRITAGAMPFLLPLMMQLGFGMSPAQSGMITFASAAGALVMRATASRVLRRFGFRGTMVWNGLIATGFVAVFAAFRPGWPIWGIYAVLLAAGFFQALQFTAYNTICYADIPPPEMSQATSFYSTVQQFMLSLGICVSAEALHVSIVLSGHTHAMLSDFSVAFLVVTAISALASPVCARLPKQAGDQLTGRQSAAPGSPGIRC